MVNMMASLSRQRGVNAVELMVTLAIIGIVAAVAMPAMSSMVDGQRLKAAATDLHSTLLLARSEAIKRNTDVELVPSANGWAGGWSVELADGTVLSEQAAYTNLTISGPDALIYTGNGRLDGATAPEFELSGGATDNIRCVTVDLSGRPANKKNAC